MKTTSLSLFSIAALLVVGLVPSVFYSQIASARENELRSQVESKVENGTELAENAQTTLEERRAEAETKVAEIKAEREAAKEERVKKLDANKLKICQRQEQKVTDVLKRASDQGTKQLEVFKKIADRTQEFATNKDLTVENYDTLVADVEAKYDIAVATMDTISSSSTEFSCEGEDPKQFLSSFRTAHQQKTEAMKAYKTAIKDLIVAVKSSQAASSGTGETSDSTTDVEAR